MTKTDDTHMKFYELRCKAEDILSKKEKRHPESLVVDIPKLIHELEVHQIELEMQNQALRETQRELEESRNKYFDLYDFAPVGYLTLNGKLLISRINLTGASMLGVERKLLLNQGFSRFVAPDFQNTYYSHVKATLKTGSRQTCILMLQDESRVPFFAQLEILPREHGQGNSDCCRIAIMDVTPQKKAEEEKEKLIGELKAALAEVKTLSGMLPICASCKKIRDDQGYWQQMEKYIRDRSEAQFSHSICPECRKKLYPDFCD